MHELSVAGALLDLVDEHAPPGATVREVHVRAGPLRAIEPEAMQMAWTVVSKGTAHEAARLRLETLPWTLRCLDCGVEREGERIDDPCPCGSFSVRPSGSDELCLVSLEVDEETPARAEREAPS